MRKVVIALTKANKVKLAYRVKKVLAEVWLTLPDTPAKIEKLNKYMQAAKGGGLLSKPQTYLNNILNSVDMFNRLDDVERRFADTYLTAEEAAMEVFWIIQGAVEFLITQYKNEPSNFEVELDVSALQTLPGLIMQDTN